MLWFEDTLLFLIILILLAGYRRMVKKMSEIEDAVTALEAKVSQDLAVDQSAVDLLNGLKALLDAALAEGGNAAALKARVQAISDQIGASTQGLADAVVKNTPAENPPAPTP